MRAETTLGRVLGGAPRVGTELGNTLDLGKEHGKDLGEAPRLGTVVGTELGNTPDVSKEGETGSRTSSSSSEIVFTIAR